MNCALTRPIRGLGFQSPASVSIVAVASALPPTVSSSRSDFSAVKDKYRRLREGTSTVLIGYLVEIDGSDQCGSQVQIDEMISLAGSSRDCMSAYNICFEPLHVYVCTLEMVMTLHIRHIRLHANLS